MANLMTVMDAACGNISLSTTQSLDGSARFVPGDPAPLDGARTSKALRMQQLSLLSHGFPLALIPAWSPTPAKDLGPFCIQYPWIFRASQLKWIGSIVQFRPKKHFNHIMKFRPIKLVKDIQQQFGTLLDSDDGFSFKDLRKLNFQSFKDAAKQFCDFSPLTIRNYLHRAITPHTSLLLSSEQGTRFKTTLLHQAADHEFLLEAAWPELYIDHKGRYWEVPESISLGVSSDASEPGFQYYFGLQKNKGFPQAVDAINDEPPSALLPGLCAKAAFSFEESRDLWRRRETEGLLPPYDIFLKEPHAEISGMIGARCAAWFGGSQDSSAVVRESYKGRSPFSVDLFGSVRCTLQHGEFRKRFGDFTRVDARLDICSASAVSRRLLDTLKGSVKTDNPLSSPSLNLIFQQQIAGPVVVRVDTKIQLDSSSSTRGPHVGDLIYSLNYYLRALRSGKVVAWYSPKRKEGMIELRIFEF